MNKTILKVLGVVLTLAAAAVLAPRSYANVDQQNAFYGQIGAAGLKIGGAVASGNSGSAVSTTTTMLNLFYNGTATAAYVTIGASSITFYAPFNVIDTSLGSATYGATGGTYDLSVATMNELGELCDAINGAVAPTVGTNGSANGGAPTGSSYHCTLTGGIRSDLSSNFLPNVLEVSGVNNLAAVGGYSIPTSTNSLMSLGILPASGRHVVMNYCSVNSGNASTGLEVYGVLAKFGVGAAGKDYFGAPVTDATLAWRSPVVTQNTTTVFPLATAVAQPWLEFGQGGVGFTYLNPPIGNFYAGHVVARVNGFPNGGAGATTSNFVSCAWMEK